MSMEPKAPAPGDERAAASTQSSKVASEQQQKIQLWQEEQIRRTTRALGFNPLALPLDDRKAGNFVKSKIRERCGKNHKITMRASLFDKAWDRMLSRGAPDGLQFADE